MTIAININYDTFLRMVFILYVLASLANMVSGVLKTERKQRTHNGMTEIGAGVLMMIIVLISVLY
ncbi:hypothetical protein KAR91_11015 [Candidatus Pacearchaeota archaeon]|nr:hypothetical protein [Candidatus Pacearchaeota archaeon]